MWYQLLHLLDHVVERTEQVPVSGICVWKDPLALSRSMRMKYVVGVEFICLLFLQIDLMF